MHDVVRHGPDEFVSLCRCEPRDCDTVPVARADLVVYEVNVRALGDSVATALGAVVSHTPVSDLPMTWCIGSCAPYAGFRFPVYMTIQLEPEDMHGVVNALAARTDGAFLLVVPTRDNLTAACEEVLRRVNSQVIILEDDFAIDAAGSLSPRRPFEDVLAPFLAGVLPTQRDGSSMVFFPTPPDATWQAVRIQFQDSHTVSVRVKNTHGVYHYAQMGMADKRSSRPTKQWILLEDFAASYGSFDWSSRRAHRSNQKRKEKLAENLREFFRIEGDPFEVVDGGAGDGKLWRTRFSLDPVG